MKKLNPKEENTHRGFHPPNPISVDDHDILCLFYESSINLNNVIK